MFKAALEVLYGFLILDKEYGSLGSSLMMLFPGSLFALRSGWREVFLVGEMDG